MRLVLFFLGVALALPLKAVGGESLAERNLKLIVAHQRELFAEAAKAGEQLDEAAFHAQAQVVAREYEAMIRENPNFAAGHAAFGYFLGKVGMRKEAVAILLKANQLDKDIPLVKNQLGNFLAEEGKPLEAVNYFISAIKLAPDEPLYHYQLGTLLAAARDDFLKSGEWTRDALDHAMAQAFKRAAELAPERTEFVYRFGESFYDLQNPDWDAALKVWGGLEEKAGTDIERQTMRLHAANVLIKQGKADHARALLETVTEFPLLGQKQKLIAQLAETAKK